MEYLQSLQSRLQQGFAILRPPEELVLVIDFGAFGYCGFDFERFDHFSILQESDFEEVGLVSDLEGSAVGHLFFEGWEGGELYDEGRGKAGGLIGILGGTGSGVCKLEAAFPDAAAAL